LIILDDIFSGLDAETEEHIFALLLGKGGLFRSMGTTVLLATNAVQRLRYADHIIAIDSKGNIAEQGSFQLLNDTSGYVQSFSAKLRPEESTQTRETVTATKSTPIISVDAEEIDPRVEDLNRQTGDFAVYKYYFSSVGLFSFLLFVSYVVLFGVASKMTEFLLTFVRTNFLLKNVFRLLNFPYMV
jgi:ATP-binding cassette subfamily C (CFTR/MRP) protein 1